MNTVIPRALDPLLSRILSRLRQLDPGRDKANLYRRHLAAAVFGPTVRFHRDAEIINYGSRDNLVIGDNCSIVGQLRLYGADGRLTLGEHSFVGPYSHVWAIREITIGRFVLISHMVDIHDNDGHPLDPVVRREDFARPTRLVDPERVPARPVRIGDDVWIGHKSSILKGVTIGEGAIIGAASVVTADVPPFTVVAGNPARVIRTLKPEPAGG